MKIYRISGKGDELILDTTVESEAREVLEKALARGCTFAINLPVQEVDGELVREIEEIFRPGIETVHILYPMAGGGYGE